MANPALEEPDALMCARPDLWEPRVATPGATRPDARKEILDVSCDCARRVNSGDHLNPIGAALGVSDQRAAIARPP